MTQKQNWVALASRLVEAMKIEEHAIGEMDILFDMVPGATGDKQLFVEKILNALIYGYTSFLLEEVAKEAKSINFSDGVDKFETRILARKHWLKKSQFYFQANEIFVVDRDIYWIVGLNPEYTLGCEYMARTEILLYDPICVDKTTGDIEDLAGPVYFNKETEDIKYSPEPSEEPIRLRLR